MSKVSLKPVDLGINFASRERGSTALLVQGLQKAIDTYQLAIPSLRRGQVTASNLPRVLTEFTAVIAKHPQLAQIADQLSQSPHDALTYRTGEGDIALQEYLASQQSPYTLDHLASPSTRGDRFSIADSTAGTTLANLYLANGWVNEAAAETLSWLGDGREVYLEGAKVFGLGGAELSFAGDLARMGAQVAVLDMAPFGSLVSKNDSLQGIQYAMQNGGGNILDPVRVAKTMVQFANGKPLHVLLHAYRGENAFETRLQYGMEMALKLAAREVEIASIFSPVSPTVPVPLTADDVERAIKNHPLQAIAARLSQNHFTAPSGFSASYNIQPKQASSYWVANFLGKVLASVAMQTLGLEGQRPQVMAPVMPITDTISMMTWLYQAGFRGAESFGVRIASPELTRALQTAVWVRNFLAPQSRPTENPWGPVAQHFDFGVNGTPLPLGRIIPMGAAMGAAMGFADPRFYFDYARKKRRVAGVSRSNSDTSQGGRGQGGNSQGQSDHQPRH